MNLNEKPVYTDSEWEKLATPLMKALKGLDPIIKSTILRHCIKNHQIKNSQKELQYAGNHKILTTSSRG